MWDRQTWVFINSFADWLSAIGTVAAVVVALYLARSDARIKLRVTVGLRILFDPAAPDERSEYFVITAINVGRRPANITNLVMRDGFPFAFENVPVVLRLIGVRPFGFFAVLNPPRNGLSADVPTTIADGETARYMVEWSEFMRLNGDKFVRRHFAGGLGRLRTELFRIGVDTSAGGSFAVKLERGLRNRFLGRAPVPK